MASRFGTTRLTASALTAHDQATTERNGSAPPPQAPRASSGDGWRSPRAANGGAPAEHAPRSGSASSAESAASDLVKPKYERQLLSEYGRIKQRNPSHAGPAAGDTAANRLSSGSTSSSASFKSFKDTPTNRDSSLFNSYRDSSVSSMPYNSNRDSLVSSSSYNTNRDSTLSSSSYASNRDSFTAPLKSNGDIKSSRPYSYNDNGVDSTTYKGNRDNSVSSSSYSNRDKGGYSAPYKSNRDSSVSSTSTYSNGVSSSSHGKSREPSSVSSSGTVREPLYSSSAFDSQTAATTREALLSSRSRDGSDPRGSTSSTASAATLPRAAAGKPTRDVKPGAGFEFDDGFVIKPPHMSARASRDYDDEVFSAEPATVTAPHVATHHGGASVASSSSSSAAAGSRPGARAWSTYKPPASPSARAMARAAAPEPALAPAQRPFGAAAANATPTRTQWNYREGGVLVQEVDEGQPCLTCHEKCPGFTPHMWRKTCNSCKCPREAHDVYHEEWVNVRERLGFEPTSGPPGQPGGGGGGGGGGGRERSRAEGYAWVPPGLPSHKIEEYFAQLPAGKVPKLSTAGEKYRDRQLLLQLPKQDLALAYCKHVEAHHSSSYEDFISARNEIALDIGYVTESTAYTKCPQCRVVLEPGEVAVVAPKLGPQTAWHPACFICCSCQELLVDLTYCVHDDQLYCERHYAEQLKPRCAACDELIFSGEYTKAMSKDWHSGHFCCWQCDESLTGQRYVLRDDHPYCIKCYESVFANTCEECNRIIGIDSKDLSYKDKHWHEACFLCTKCRVSLVDKQFGSKADKIYCGNCYDAQFASRCDGCGEIFRAGTKKMEYKTRQWHEKCFCCCVCKTPIGTKSFIPREQEIYCAGCYEEKFATRCVKCNKIITSGGVTYKNEPWHRECFTCTHCNTSLAGQRFTSRDEKPYCADCFGELFAKRCTSCSKPITGIGGTRFISFEDRHWHNDCFICAMCKTSLVGRGFITDADDIICPECAKQKLM